jgi:hypothetical protein
VAALAHLVTVAQAAPTDDKPRAPTTTVVVDFAPAAGTRAWLATAFELAVARELSGFDRLTPVAKTGFRTRECGADTACRLRVYREAHVDLVMLGRATDDAIDYELYQTWTPARVATGSIAIGRGQTPIGLAHETRAALHPVLKHGGLLDQRPHMYGTQDRPAPAWTMFDPVLVLGALALALLPFAWFALLARDVRRVRTLRSARRLARAGIGVALLGLVAAWYGSFAALVAAAPWPFAAAGGLAWGAIAIVAVRGVFPSLDGLARVAHHDVWRILGAWFALAVLRLALATALYAPAIAAALALADRLGVASPWDVVLLVPAVCWFAHAWLAAWVECLAAWHDRRFVDGAATRDNPRARELAHYLTGYVRRTGWDLDPALLARVLLLPGNVDGIVTYGGGSTHARIVVDKQLIALALGEPEEVPDDRQVAVFPAWTAAVVAPGQAAGVRNDASIVELRARKPRTAVYRRPLGRAATLLGYVIPAPGESVPLISDNPRDLAVVRSLLSEHYPWDAPDPDDEFDTTDPTDKDFLFGALVRELGVVQRGDSQLQTFKLVLGARIGRIATRVATRIADTFTVLNFARHHFLQYLHHRATGATELLTARARGERLDDTSLKIVAAARHAKPSARRRRLIWLAWFVGEPIVDARDVRRRRVLAAGIAAIVLAAIGVAAKQAIDYHPTYVKRIASQQREIEKRERERKQQEGSANGEVKAK